MPNHPDDHAARECMERWQDETMILIGIAIGVGVALVIGGGWICWRIFRDVNNG